MRTLKTNQESKKSYTVWVGGIEVVDYLLTKDEANDVREHYMSEGYTDVEISEYN